MASGPPTEVPPPLQDIPTAKEKKYDRQLRLWGAAGQVALEETNILLINNGSGVTGIETLKNLVLPGIGNFTILDSSIVTEADLGVNFFLEDTSLGKFRAEETVKYLEELNPDGKGHAITEPVTSWVAKDKILTPYTLVMVAAPIDPAILSVIQDHTTALQIPTFYIHSIGFYSCFSLQLPGAFPIVDTHPDPTAITDLRILSPWPALSEFANRETSDMDKMNGEQFAHMPYVCLLLHYIEQWKASHDGKLPIEYKEKQEFKNLVRSGSPSEENFDEACAAVIKLLKLPEIPKAVQEILTAPEAQSLTPTSPPFWLIANAVQQFCQKHGQLPLPGAVPDMKARSNTYVELQNIYKTKAREDAAEVLATVRSLEKTSNLPPIDEKEVENFCKNAAHISLVRGRPLKIIHPGNTPLNFDDQTQPLYRSLQNDESLLPLYLSFLAWDEFTATHKTDQETLLVPGSSHPPSSPHNDDEGTTTTPHPDHPKLTAIAHTLLDALITAANARMPDPQYSALQQKVSDYCLELTRAGGSELHNIASLTGGMVAQEVIKVITKQYVPVDNTCVFDGIASRTWVGRV